MTETSDRVSFGLVMAGQTRQINNVSLFYRVPCGFESQARDFARRFGIGFQFIGAGCEESESDPIGVLARSSAHDPNGQLVGFLRATSLAFGQEAVLYQPEPLASWQILSIDTAARHSSATGIGYFAADRLDTLVSILLSQSEAMKSDECEVPPAFDISLDRIANLSLLHRCGWLGSWRRSLDRPGR